MKVLIVNAYSASNKGDAGIVIAMIHYFRSRWPKCEISVMSSYSSGNKDFYLQYDAQSVPNVWELKASQSAISRYRIGLMTFLGILLFGAGKNAEAYKNADLVASAGGGYLYSSRKGPLGVGLLNALFHYWLGIKLGKVTVGFPQSVGPFHWKFDKFVVAKVLKRANMIFGREKQSTDFLDSVDICNKEVSDIAFTLPAPKRRNPKNLIGITVLDWRFAKKNLPSSAIDSYIEKLANTITILLEDYDISVEIYPQVDVSENDSDVAISQKLASLVNNPKCKVVKLSSVSTAEDLVNLYSSTRVFIASRMHSAIFALAGKVPTIGLAYQPKTTGTFKRLGIGEFCHDIQSFDATIIENQVRGLLDQKIHQPEINSSRILEDIDSGLKIARANTP